MRLILADPVRGVLIEDDLVLLDTETDAYFCLPAGDQTLGLAHQVLDVEPDELGRALVDAGLAQPAATDGQALGAALIPPRRTARALLDEQSDLKKTPVHWRHLRALIQALGRATDAQRRRFAQRLDGRVGERGSLTPTLLSDLAIYRRLVPWLPIDGACLFRSEMLRAYLRALGHDATWTFGVRTWPFRAHCWLQVEDVALDDEAERLAAFHLIMAV